jgi:hypothetical protein
MGRKIFNLQGNGLRSSLMMRMLRKPFSRVNVASGPSARAEKGANKKRTTPAIILDRISAHPKEISFL